MHDHDIVDTDLQGFAVRGYNFPFARFLFLEISSDNGPEFVGRLVGHITTAKIWDRKPSSVVNVAFTYKGLVNLKLPTASLLSFPVEFVQGMKERAAILGDTGRNSPQKWDLVWNVGTVHAWLGVHAVTPMDLDSRCSELFALMQSTQGATLAGSQDASCLIEDGRPTQREHFGFIDGFGNPDYYGIYRNTQPGQGKLDNRGYWEPLATGELLLGYPDEAGELPVAPVPNQFAKNGTFMVYRKLHQNIAAFRSYLDEQAHHYARDLGTTAAKEKLAAKMIGRWRDGSPLELCPDFPDPSIVQDPGRSTNFTYSNDPYGIRCPLGAHIRRANPRDAFGFQGGLVNHRRITRRSLPYGPSIPEGDPVNDADEHGMCFIALNASISRQFEFIYQHWIGNGHDAGQGSDKDILVGNHEGRESFVIQGTDDPNNPPFVCGRLPNFVELRGGDYFFVPSMTALKMIATGTVRTHTDMRVPGLGSVKPAIQCCSEIRSS